MEAEETTQKKRYKVKVPPEDRDWPDEDVNKAIARAGFDPTRRELLYRTSNVGRLSAKCGDLNMVRGIAIECEAALRACDRNIQGFLKACTDTEEKRKLVHTKGQMARWRLDVAAVIADCARQSSHAKPNGSREALSFKPGQQLSNDDNVIQLPNTGVAPPSEARIETPQTENKQTQAEK